MRRASIDTSPDPTHVLLSVHTVARKEALLIATPCSARVGAGVVSTAVVREDGVKWFVIAPVMIQVRTDDAAIFNPTCLQTSHAASLRVCVPLLLRNPHNHISYIFNPSLGEDRALVLCPEG